MPGKKKTASADGERRAISGYGNQYDSAALVIFDALADASLNWIGVGYRLAGNADDVVIGRPGHISGFQFKSSKYPATFTLNTILLGAKGLWKPLVDAWVSLRAAHPGHTVDIYLQTSDIPSTGDKVGSGSGKHSAAFLEAFKVRRHKTLAEWASSPWSSFIATLHAVSELPPDQFETFLASFHVTPGLPDAQEAIARLPDSQRRQVKSLADTLPRLVRDPSGRETWPRALLLERLGWSDVHSTIHSHQFPVGPFVQRNVQTERLLLAAIQSAVSGYISLVGPPGVGKSTILQTSITSEPHLRVARYLAYVPGGGQGLGRAEADDFLSDVVSSLKLTGLFTTRIHDSSLAERRRHFADILRAAAERYERNGIRTLIVIDGLDHIPREERPTHSLLAELPSPQSVPSGVLFILGTQRLDLPSLPPSVREQADDSSRKVEVKPLTLEAVCRIADQLGLASDIDRSKVFEITRGHPLVTRYLVEALKAAGPKIQKELLAGSLNFDGDIESVYKAAWRDVEQDEAAREVLAYIVRSEAPLAPELLAERLSENAIETALKACQHLLKTSPQGWSVFHNSFRLFVIAKPKLRFGKPQDGYSDSIYRDLAHLARSPAASAAQRWLELRYSARAHEYRSVLALAIPEVFRRQLLEGRPDTDIFLDSRLALEAAKQAGDTTDVVRILFARDEISRRSQAFSYAQDLPAAYIAVGDIEMALNFVQSYPEKAFLVVDELVKRGDIDRARLLFEQNEPVAKLLAGGYENSAGEAIWRDAKEWAKRAVLFRDIEQLQAAIHAIGVAAVTQDRGSVEDAESYQRNLRYIVASQLFEQDPDADFQGVVDSLKVDSAEHIQLLLKVGFVQQRLGNVEKAFAHFEKIRAHPDYSSVGSDARRRIVACAIRHERFDIASEIFAELKAPYFSLRDETEDRLDYDGDAEKLILHACLAAALRVHLADDLSPQSGAARVLNAHLISLGAMRAKSEFGSGKIFDGEVSDLANSVLGFFCRYRPGRSFAIGRELYMVAPAVAEVLFEAANACGDAELKNLIRSFDKLVDLTSGWDPRSSGLLQRLAVEGARQIYRFGNGKVDVSPRLEAIVPLLHEDTPEAQLDAYAALATAFAAMGNAARGKELLDRAATEGFGNALPPKKDPQYALWVDLLNEACIADPAGRLRRVGFLARQLSGMRKTEGDATADRIAPDLIQEAAQVDAQVSLDVARWINQLEQVRWPNLINAMLIGLVRRRPDMVEACVQTWCSLALPFYIEPYFRDSSIGDFPTAAIKANREKALDVGIHLRKNIETFSQANERLALLESVDTALRELDLVDPLLAVAITREKEQAPEPRHSYTPGRYDDKPSLHELASALEAEGKEPGYEVPYAFERVLRTAGYDEARQFFDRWKVLQESATARFALVEYAIDEGRTDQAADLTNAYQPDVRSDSSWTRSFGGHARNYFSARLRLEGAIVRKEAFNDFIESLLAGNENYSYMLVDLVDILKVLDESPDWPEIWNCLEEQIKSTREHSLGHDIELAAGAKEDAVVLGALFKWAFTLPISEIHLHAEAAWRFLATVPHGAKVLEALIEGLLSAEGDEPAIGMKLLNADLNDVLRDVVSDKLAALALHPDFVVAEIARELATRWNVQVPSAHQDLPLFYSLHIPSASGRGIAGEGLLDADSRSMRIEDPLAWTARGVDSFLAVLEDAGVPRSVVRERVGMIISLWGGVSKFGANADRLLDAELGRLGMRIPFLRPNATATLRALRYVAQELICARIVQNHFVEALRFQHGCLFPPKPQFSIFPKPPFIERIAVDRSLWSEEETLAAWNASGSSDFRSLVDGDDLVIAEVSEFELHDSLKGRFRLERLRLPNCPSSAGSDLEQYWRELPSAHWDGAVAASPKVVSPYIVRRYSASYMPDGSFRQLVVCPNLCVQLGWSLAPSDFWTYIDSENTVVARIVNWQDAGPVDAYTSFVRGRGCCLLMSHAGLLQAERVLGAIDNVDVHVERECRITRGTRVSDSVIRHQTISIAEWKAN